MYLITTLVLICLLSREIQSIDKRCYYDDEVEQKTTTDIIESHGYPHETHRVVTDDGYILEMHRIPYSPNGIPRNRKRRKLLYRRDGESDPARGPPVAFLMHGIVSSSADWVVMGPDVSLAYILSDDGYDVWMGNARGNRYSREHVELDPDDDSDFWEFSWHEIGTMDLPVMIDYVLATSGRQSLQYVGYSQGTTTFFVMCSELPEYNAKISSMHALAPVAYVEHIRNPIALAAVQVLAAFEFSVKTKGAYEFLASSDMLVRLGHNVCSDEIATAGCSRIFFWFLGYPHHNASNFDNSMLPEILHNVPAGASSNQFIHFGQLVKSGKFRQYDHGIFENQLIYNSIGIPEYELDKITTPIFLYRADNDNLSDLQDVTRLAAELPNVKETYRVDYAEFTHIDFLYATDLKEVLYDRVVKNMNKYL